MAQPYVWQQDFTGYPGWYVSLVGSFPGAPVVRLQRIDGSSAPAEASATTITATTSTALCQQLQVPQSLALGLYAVWVKDGATASAVAYLNRARALYLEYGECVAGSTVMRAFGSNLRLAGATPTVRFVNGGNSFNAVVNVSSSDEEVLTFTVPAGLATGASYTVYVSNGYGGTYGEVNPVSGQTVTAVASPTDPYSFNVPWADYVYTVRASLSNGATGAAIQTALTNAGTAGGGVVTLGPGSYTGNLSLPAGVILKGPDPGTGTATISGNITFNGSRTALVDLTITSTGTWTGPASGSSKLIVHRVSSTHSPNNSHVWEIKGVSNVLFSSWAQTVNPVSNRPVNFTANGAVYPFYLHIRGCTFRYLSYRWHLSDIRYATVENTTINGDFTLGAYRITDRGGWNCEFAWYTTFLRCTMTETGTISLGGAVGTTGIRVTSNDGESMNWQGGSSHGTWRIYQGIVSSATSTTITDTSQGASAYSVVNTTGTQYSIAIIEGTGKGQFRDVSAVNSGTKTLTVSPAWDVTPDTTSVYVCERVDARHVLVKGCTFDRVMRGLWFYTGGYDLTIVDNVFISAEIWLQSIERDGTNQWAAVSGGSSNEVYWHWKSFIARNTLTNPSNTVIHDTGGSGHWNYSAGLTLGANFNDTTGVPYMGTYFLCHSLIDNAMTTFTTPMNRTGGAGVGPNIPENITIGVEDQSVNDAALGYAGHDPDTDPLMALVVQGNSLTNANPGYHTGSGTNQIIITDTRGPVTSVTNTTGSGAGHAALNIQQPTATSPAFVIRERIVPATAALSGGGAPATTYDTLLSTTLATKLVARYRFEDTSGNLIDDKGTGNFAPQPTLNYAQPSLVAALPGGKSLGFGTGGYAQVAPSGWPTGDFEIHATVKRAADNVWNTFFASPRLRIAWRADNLIYFEIWNATDTLVLRAGNGVGATTVLAASTHHLACTRVGEAMSLRVDNTLQPNFTSQTGSGSDPLWAFSGTLNARAANATRIGQDGTSNIGGADQSSGLQIDELLVFNTGLTTPERDALYTAWGTAPSGSPTTGTRTVPATAALRGTTVRTVPATAAVTVVGLLRTVPATAAFSRAGVIRTVPATAALSRSGLVRTVTATAAVSQISVRTVSATAALQATVTRTVPATAALTGTQTRTVPATASLQLATATVPRTVPATAALSLAGLTRTVPATASIAVIGTRTVPATAALQGAGIRTVPATASLSAVVVPVTQGSVEQGSRTAGVVVRGSRTTGTIAST